jgi:hypothetical protein
MAGEFDNGLLFACRGAMSASRFGFFVDGIMTRGMSWDARFVRNSQSTNLARLAVAR